MTTPSSAATTTPTGAASSCDGPGTTCVMDVATGRALWEQPVTAAPQSQNYVGKESAGGFNIPN